MEVWLRLRDRNLLIILPRNKYRFASQVKGVGRIENLVGQRDKGVIGDIYFSARSCAQIHETPGWWRDVSKHVGLQARRLGTPGCRLRFENYWITSMHLTKVHVYHSSLSKAFYSQDQTDKQRLKHSGTDRPNSNQTSQIRKVSTSRRSSTTNHRHLPLWWAMTNLLSAILSLHSWRSRWSWWTIMFRSSLYLSRLFDSDSIRFIHFAPY